LKYHCVVLDVMLGSFQELFGSIELANERRRSRDAAAEASAAAAAAASAAAPPPDPERGM
jgi:hypothetical protein